MKKPVLIIKDNLLMPIQATERRISEINKEMASTGNPVILNGLFLMAVSYIESMQKEVLKSVVSSVVSGLHILQKQSIRGGKSL